MTKKQLKENILKGLYALEDCTDFKNSEITKALDAIQAIDIVEKQAINYDKAFEISSVCRADLKDICSVDQITSLTDADMERIAEKMGSAYCDGGFWQDLKIITEYILDEKKGR